MNKNEENLFNYVKSIINHDDNVSTVRNYIKENYNVDSRYDKETNVLYIYSKFVNESLNVVAAKEYIYDTIGEDMITVEYGN